MLNIGWKKQYILYSSSSVRQLTYYAYTRCFCTAVTCILMAEQIHPHVQHQLHQLHSPAPPPHNLMVLQILQVSASLATLHHYQQWSILQLPCSHLHQLCHNHQPLQFLPQLPHHQDPQQMKLPWKQKSWLMIFMQSGMRFIGGSKKTS